MNKNIIIQWILVAFVTCCILAWIFTHFFCLPGYSSKREKQDSIDKKILLSTYVIQNMVPVEELYTTFQDQPSTAPYHNNHPDIQLKEGYYWGKVDKKGYIHGKGFILYTDSMHTDYYQGEFNHGWIAGKGVMAWLNGTKYSGEWSYGNMWEGTLSYPNGCRFVGHIMGSRFRWEYSEGIFYNGNQSYLECKWSNGMPKSSYQTPSIWHYSNGNYEEVTYRDGYIEGEAKLHLAEGKYAIGKYFHSKRTGRWKVYDRFDRKIETWIYQNGICVKVK